MVVRIFTPMPSPDTDPRPPYIRALYEAFADRTIPDRLSYCTYCDDEAYERSLHAPLETLDRALVGKYLADAIHHTGNEQDFLYFIPRILELEDVESLTFFFVLPDRLKSASFASWSEPRRCAVLRALEHIASSTRRDDSWYETLASIDGVDWNAIFERRGAILATVDPTDFDRERFVLALEYGGLFDALSPLAAAKFDAFSASDRGRALLESLSRS